MTLDQIYAFVAVAHTLSFTEASTLRFSTQQGISRQISNLEQELGFRLFQRTTKKVELTPQGIALLPHLEAALKEIEAGLDESRIISEKQTEKLRIGIANISHLIGIAKRQRIHLLQAHPELTIQNKIKPVGHLINMLLSRDVDIIICLGSELSNIRTKGLKVKCLETLDEYICISCHHPFADRPTLDLKDMNGQVLFLLSSVFSPIAKILHKDVLKRADVKPIEIRYCDSLDDLELSLYSGKGFAIIPNIFFEDPEEALILHQIPNDYMGKYRETVVAVWRNNDNVAIQNYVNILSAS